MKKSSELQGEVSKTALALEGEKKERKAEVERLNNLQKELLEKTVKEHKEE